MDGIMYMFKFSIDLFSVQNGNARIYSLVYSNSCQYSNIYGTLLVYEGIS